MDNLKKLHLLLFFEYFYSLIAIFLYKTSSYPGE